MEKGNFIKIGNDRLRLSCIEAYDIRPWNRYFVRNEAHSEVEQSMYRTAFTMYSEDDDECFGYDPMLDINDCTVCMDRKPVKEGQLPPTAFDVEASRALCVRGKWLEKPIQAYVEGRVDFDIDAKLAELDKIFLEKNSDATTD